MGINSIQQLIVALVFNKKYKFNILAMHRLGIKDEELWKSFVVNVTKVMPKFRAIAFA